MSEAVREPTGEQAEAADARRSDVFLEAGAGTGKTGVLVARYCDAVSRDGVTPEQILAFTFTEKAAAELRHRVRAELVRRARAADGDEATELAGHIRALGAAPITTIHGYCRRLLASHPVSAGLDPRFRVLDAPEARRIGWEAFDLALEDFAAEAGADGEQFVALLQVFRARQIVLASHEGLVSRGDAPKLPPVRPRDPAPSRAELARAIDSMAEAGKGNAGQKETAAAAQDLLASAGAGELSLAALEEIEPVWSSSVPEVSALKDAIREAIAVATEPGPGLAAFGFLDTLLRAFARRYEELKTERSGLDFEDLQRRAVDLLVQNTEIGTSYRDRFRHILVDEFQDTNALQLRLVDALRGAETRLFCVGDEFQSIYGFRHADIDVFTGERTRFAESPSGRTMKLRGNFRSQPQIVAAVNEFGNATLPGFTDLTVARSGADPVPVEMLITEPGDWKDHEGVLGRPETDRAPLECTVEARSLALRLRKLVDDEKRSPGEIVILLRAFSQVEAFETALTRAGLPNYVVGGGGYWSRQQAQDMVALLGTIANPLADEPLLGALASPAGGVAPDTLWSLRAAVGRGGSLWIALLAAAGLSEPALEDQEAVDALPEAERDRLERFARSINGLRDEGTRMSLEALLGRAVEETGYDLAVLRADHGRERYANVRKMMRLARDFESVEGRDLRAFLDYAALSAEQDAEAPAAVESEEGEGVRVMTVHAAKGLEFPVVAVAQLGRALSRGGTDPDLAIGRPGEDPLRAGLRLTRLGADPVKLFDYEDLVAERRDREEAEELRLAYVAVTRARDRLILSGVRDEQNHQDRSLPVLRRVLHHLGAEAPADGDVLGLRRPDAAPEFDIDVPECQIRVAVSAASEQEARRLTEKKPPLAVGDPGEVSPPPIVCAAEPALPARTLSYSTLQEHARCGYRFYVERVLGLGAVERGFGESEPSRNRALQIGNATHELLRRSAVARWAMPGDAAVSAALAAEGLDPGDPDGAARVAGAVRSWLDSPLPGELRGGGVRIHAEHPFLLDIGETPIRGSIDLLAERAGRPPLVIDYKTDRLRGDDPAARAEGYAIQRSVYAVAVAAHLGVSEVEVAYVFLERPEEPARFVLGETELAAARAELTEAVGAINAGSFEVTAEPSWPLCSDCPARKRLCPAPATRD